MVEQNIILRDWMFTNNFSWKWSTWHYCWQLEITYY